jgi:hypothetical protein
VILLGPLVPVLAVLTRHLAVPVALALVERGEPDRERDITDARSQRVSPGGSRARSSASVSATSSRGRRLPPRWFATTARAVTRPLAVPTNYISQRPRPGRVSPPKSDVP